MVVVVVVVVCCCVFCCGVLAGGGTLSTTMMSPAGTGFGLTVVGISLGDTGCETVLSAGCVVPVVPTGFVWASIDLGSLAGSRRHIIGCLLGGRRDQRILQRRRAPRNTFPMADVERVATHRRTIDEEVAGKEDGRAEALKGSDDPVMHILDIRRTQRHVRRAELNGRVGVVGIAGRISAEPWKGLGASIGAGRPASRQVSRPLF